MTFPFPLDHLDRDQLGAVLDQSLAELADLDAELAFAQRIADDMLEHGHTTVADAIECIGVGGADAGEAKSA